VVVNRDSRPFLLHNIVKPRGHWMMLRVLEEHGRDALGAEVTMTIGARTIHRDVRAASSYLASNDPRVHVGLGNETMVRDVIVRWPNGAQERFGDLPADRIAVLRRGSGR
jgi:enediyne biosynthesis protein E4